ncbi:MAG: hypothetical protein EOO07_34140 [Chitinophagaceae bacterium]|nr:MAG: hypothetical protein EOO07_34140 [Chitinophagaceae bacterium]
MKKVLLGLILCGFITATCKKEESKACYECSTKITSTMGGQVVTSSISKYEQCDLSASDAKSMEGTENSTSSGMATSSTTTCSKK